jgi:GAF domain-containing protein
MGWKKRVVLLAILEAVNKQKGIFTTDDLNLVTVLCTIIGISLKNALIYDNLTLTQNKFKKFASVIIFFFLRQPMVFF